MARKGMSGKGKKRQGGNDRWQGNSAVLLAPLEDAHLGSWWRSIGGIRHRLAQPVAADSFAFFRCAYGLMMAWTMTYYLFGGRAERLLFGTIVKFRYQGFEWVPVFGKTGSLTLCWIAFLAALALGLGVRYRTAAAAFATCYGVMFFYDVSNYNNHDYLVVMFGFIFALVPHSSVATIGRSTSPRSIPTWGLWLLMFSIALPYFFGGLAKLNYDWLVLHEPMTVWFSQGRVEGLDRTVSNPELWGSLLSLGGLAFDLLIVPLLLWRRTRVVAYLACVAFHVANSQLFNIGPFPWLMIAATPVLFAPAWPQRFRLTKRIPLPSSHPLPPLAPWVTILLTGWLILQLVLPFRHLLYPGPVHWNEEGARFAWRMKLRDKVATTIFHVSEGEGPWTRVEGLDFALTKRQIRKMEHKPEMVRQFATFLGNKLDPTGTKQLRIRVDYSVSLNGRKAQPLIDPAIDLLSLERRVPSSKWLLPLAQ